MNYTVNSKIQTLGDVKNFFHHIVYERKVNFHPDDMFEDYVSCQGGINTFTLQECTLYNRLMDECFTVCDKAEADIYEIAMEIMKGWISDKTNGKDVSELEGINGEMRKLMVS